MRKWVAVVIGLTLILLSLPAAAASRTQSLRLSWNGTEPALFDSTRTTADSDLLILSHVMEGLVRADADGAIQKGSGAAEDWSISDDGLTYTFTLKQGLTWSDGKPLTAMDFATAWLRVLDPKAASDYSYLLYYIKGAVAWNALDPSEPDFAARHTALRETVGIQTPDKRTLVVTLEAPAPFFLSVLTFPVTFPVRQDMIDRTGSPYGTNLNTIVFSGPFVISAWTPGQEIRLAPNSRYKGSPKAALSQISIKFHADDAEAVRQYDSGLLDMVKLRDGAAAKYKTRPDYRAESRETVHYLAFNCNQTKSPILSNVHIRRAISLALDRKTLASVEYEGAAVPATGLVPDGIHISGVSFRKAVGAVFSPQADVTAARAELAAGLQELDLKTLPPLELLILNSNTYQKPAAAIKRMVEQNLPGVTIRISPVSFRDRMERMASGTFDMAYTAWAADFDDPATVLDIMFSSAAWNGTGWGDSRYDAFAYKAGLGGERDPIYRLFYYAQAERVLRDEVPVAPLLFPASASLRRPYVQGIIPTPLVPWVDLRQAWIVP